MPRGFSEERTFTLHPKARAEDEDEKGRKASRIKKYVQRPADGESVAIFGLVFPGLRE